MLCLSSTACDKTLENLSREPIPIPGEFRMPLNAKNKSVAAFILDAFDHTVLCPRNRPKVLANLSNSLVMMRIYSDRSAILSNGRQASQYAVPFDVDRMRVAI